MGYGVLTLRAVQTSASGFRQMPLRIRVWIDPPVGLNLKQPSRYQILH
jgi:hypothetical protein